MTMAMRMRRFLRATVAAIAIALAAGCGGGGPDPLLPSDIPSGTYDIRGSIVSVDRVRNIVEIDHEAIPGVMPAMTMPYEVADPALLQGLSPGDRVQGTLRVDARGFVLIALARR